MAPFCATFFCDFSQKHAQDSAISLTKWQGMAHNSAISFWEGSKRFLVVDSIKKGQTRAFLRSFGTLFMLGVDCHPFCARLSENGAEMALFGKMASQTSIDLRRLFGLRNGLLGNVYMHADDELSQKRLDFERFCAFWHLVDTLEARCRRLKRGRGSGGSTRLSLSYCSGRVRHTHGPVKARQSREWIRPRG